ncbi:MAG: hypothetical protein Q8O67_10670 [Deltaproteobacteria bacterium]|nr:hypothetical protein [Deltaproteobacteria bacterium]
MIQGTRAAAVVVVVVGCLGCCVDPASDVPRVRLAAGAAFPVGDPPPALDLGGVPAGVEAFDLGVLAMTAGRSAEVLVDVDGGVRSFTFLVSAHEGASVVVDRVEDPRGALVVDPTPSAEVSRLALRLSRGFAGPFLSTNRMAAKSGGAFTVPATPAVELVTGTWRARLAQGVVDVDDDGAFGQTPFDRPVRLVVLVDTRPPTARARLPIALHFTGDDGLSAASAPASPLVQQVLSTLQQTFEPAGVDVEDAGFFDVDDGAFQTLELAPDLCDDGDLTLLLRSLPPTPALDVVFVDRLRCVVRGDVVVDGFAGLAAAIPGAGLALAVGVVGDDPEQAGVVVAHEVGHLLGLFHTVEQASGADPLIFDILADTPDDPTNVSNLMHFAPETSTSLTADQVAVVRLSPWLQD